MRNGEEEYNGLPKLLNDARFYAELEPELIERTFRMLDSARREVVRFAEQVLAGLVRHGRITSEEVEWRRHG